MCPALLLLTASELWKVLPFRFVSQAFPARAPSVRRNFSLIMDGHGGTIAALSSPSPGSSPKVAMSVSPSLEAGGGSPSSMSGTLPARLPRVSGAGDAELQARLQGLHLAQRAAPASADGGSASASAASSSMATAGGADDDDGFGDFEASSCGCALMDQQEWRSIRARRGTCGMQLHVVVTSAGSHAALAEFRQPSCI